MSYTTDYIGEGFGISIDYLEAAFPEGDGDDVARIEEQVAEERKMALNPESKCPELDLASLNPEVMKCGVKNEVNNANYVRSMECITQKIVSGPIGNVPEYISLNPLGDVGSISGQVGFGNITMGTREDDDLTVKTPYVIKYPQDDFELHTVYHEAVVGLYALNHLRQYIPNFAYIFGAFECSKPTDGPNGTSWCNGMENKTHYVVYEKVEGQTFYDWSKTATVAEFYNAYTQVLLALLVANERYDFSHYDLHSDNIIVVKLDRPGYIVYPTQSEHYYIRAEYVPVIIDYGNSFIKINGKGYGDPRRVMESGINVISNTHSNVLSDAYKLMLMTARNNPNLSVVNEIGKLLVFFNDDETLQEVLEEQRKFYFSLPPTQDVVNEGKNDFINFISFVSETSGEHSPIVTNPDPNIPILSNEGRGQNYYALLGVGSPPNYRTTMKYYLSGTNSPPEDNLNSPRPSVPEIKVSEYYSRRVIEMKDQSSLKLLHNDLLQFQSWKRDIALQTQALELIASRNPAYEPIYSRYSQLKLTNDSETQWMDDIIEEVERAIS